MCRRRRSSRISLQHAREQIEQYGRDNPWVLVNIFGQFPPSSLNALIGPDEVREAQKRFYREYELKRDGSRSGRSTTPNAFLA
jgi:phage terminase large subunit